jgi:hypothetical protein
MRQVSKIAFPAESGLDHADASFADAYEAELRDAAMTPVEIALRATGATPDWVTMLLRLRDRIVAPLDLKTVDRLSPAQPRPAASYGIGDSIGIFHIFSSNERELVVGIDDQHLDVRVSFLKRLMPARSTYAVCSVVETHNLLGRLYMIPVGRVHPLVVRAMMRRAEV